MDKNSKFSSYPIFMYCLMSARGGTAIYDPARKVSGTGLPYMPFLDSNLDSDCSKAFPSLLSAFEDHQGIA